MTVVVVPTVSTDPHDAGRWIRTRHYALVQALVARGWPFDLALALAPPMLAHQARETGTGRNEWNYSPGNPKGVGTPAPAGEPGWHGQVMWLTNAVEGRELYRAYGSILDGEADYVRLMEREFKHPLSYLVQHPDDGAGWYLRLMAAGYHPYTADAIPEFTDRLNRIKRELGYA